MKVGGQLLQSRVALYDGQSSGELYIYSDDEVALEWGDYLKDVRIFRTDSNAPEKVYTTKTGIYSLSYVVNSKLDRSKKRDNVKVQVYLNGKPLSKTISYSYIRNEDMGEATNFFSGNILIEQPNSVLEIRIQRHKSYKGVIILAPSESSFSLKRERPI